MRSTSSADVFSAMAFVSAASSAARYAGRHSPALGSREWRDPFALISRLLPWLVRLVLSGLAALKHSWGASAHCILLWIPSRTGLRLDLRALDCRGAGGSRRHVRYRWMGRAVADRDSLGCLHRLVR